MKKTTYLKNIFDSRLYQFIVFIFLLKPLHKIFLTIFTVNFKQKMEDCYARLHDGKLTYSCQELHNLSDYLIKLYLYVRHAQCEEKNDHSLLYLLPLQTNWDLLSATEKLQMINLIMCHPSINKSKYKTHLWWIVISKR